MRTNSARNTAWILITSENMLFPCVRVEREFKLYKSKVSSALILTSTEFRTTWGSSAPCQVNLIPLEIPVCSCSGHTGATGRDSIGTQQPALPSEERLIISIPLVVLEITGPFTSCAYLHSLFAFLGCCSTFQVCKPQVGIIFTYTLCIALIQLEFLLPKPYLTYINQNQEKSKAEK